MKTRSFPILLCVLSVFAFGRIRAQIADTPYLRLYEMLEIVESNYVDSVDQAKVVETVIAETLASLDPHSVYITKEQVEEVNEPLIGNFEGIGVQFNLLHDTIFVVNPIPGGPSERVGIKAGDRIVAINGEPVAGCSLTNKDVKTRLMGKKGSKVKILVVRRGAKAPIEFTVSRDRIPIESIDAAYMVTPEIGYIKINCFSATTLSEFKAASRRLLGMGMIHLVIDLKGNSGGYLSPAIDVADELLEGSKLIVYTEGTRSPRAESYSTSGGCFQNGRLAILIDEESASASEILAGAVQDWDRGIVVGRRSFGKGLVQRQFDLGDGSQIRLTVARYYTPSGRLIQRPYDEGTDEYNKDFFRRYENGEYAHQDSIHFPDSLLFYTMRTRRPVYGGGGIMPDVFVPIDTSAFSDYYRKLFQQGIFNRFAIEYVDSHRNELRKSYLDFDSFHRGFQVEGAVMEAFVSFATAEGVEFNADDFSVSESEIKILVKAYIASTIWNIEKYFVEVNQLNPALHKAIELVANSAEYDRLLNRSER